MVLSACRRVTGDARYITSPAPLRGFAYALLRSESWPGNGGARPAPRLGAQVLRDALEHLVAHVCKIGNDGCHGRRSPPAHRIQFGGAKRIGRMTHFAMFIVRFGHRKLP